MQKEERQRLIQEAKETSLTEYFRASGYKLRQHGHEVYVDGLPGHQLCINSATNQWFDHYTGAGASNNAVECLIQVLDKSFEQAVFELTGRDISFSRAEEFPKSFRPQYTSPPRPAKPEPYQSPVAVSGHPGKPVLFLRRVFRQVRVEKNARKYPLHRHYANFQTGETVTAYIIRRRDELQP